MQSSKNLLKMLGDLGVGGGRRLTMNFVDDNEAQRSLKTEHSYFTQTTPKLLFLSTSFLS